MAKYLRDGKLTNIKVTEELIDKLIDVYTARSQVIPQRKAAGVPNSIYTIRFDGRGYRTFTKEELLRYFQKAKKIERIILTLETSDSVNSNRSVGEYIEIQFDGVNDSLCNLVVTSDEADWVDASFSSIQEALTDFKSKNGIARSAWSTLAVQVIGVVSGFILSLWAASIISPKLSLENSFIIAFIFAFVIFSNIWAYLNLAVLRYIHLLFPNIHFYRSDKDKINWWMQGVIAGISTAVALYVLSLVFSFVGTILSEIPK